MSAADFGTWYEATYPRLWSWVRRVVSDLDVASDIAQEAFVRLLKTEHHTLPEEQRAAYLFTIARNLMNDHYKRSARARESLSDSDDDTDGIAAVGLRDVPASIDLDRAMAAITTKERSAVWLAYVEGWDHRTIARILGVGEKSVKVLLFRARQKLIEQLGGQP